MNLELKIPPVVAGFITAMLMWLSKLLLPVFSFQSEFTKIVLVLLTLTGVIIAISGILSFNRAQTSTNPLDPSAASSLVVTGIYRFSRNPMYLGFSAVLAAWGFHLSNILSIVLTLLFVFYMNRFQVKPEERILEAKFGDAFRNYKKQTRRWI